MFRFVEQEKASYPVATMCRVLGASPSGYWAWARRPPSVRARADAELTETIRDIHRHSRGTYGVPRVHAELHDSGRRCSRKRVARLMRDAGLVGVHRRRSERTTVQNRAMAPAPDLVEPCPGRSRACDAGLSTASPEGETRVLPGCRGRSGGSGPHPVDGD